MNRDSIGRLAKANGRFRASLTSSLPDRGRQVQPTRVAGVRLPTEAIQLHRQVAGRGARLLCLWDRGACARAWNRRQCNQQISSHYPKRSSP